MDKSFHNNVLMRFNVIGFQTLKPQDNVELCRSRIGRREYCYYWFGMFTSVLIRILIFAYFTLQDRATFRRIVLKNAYMKRKMYEQLLESVPLLKHLEVSRTFHINFYNLNV